MFSHNIYICIYLCEMLKIHKSIKADYLKHVTIICCIIANRKPIIHLKISEKRILATHGLICIKRKQCGNRRHLVRYTP